MSRASAEAWGLYLNYPSLIRQGMDGSFVDYQPALMIAAREGLEDPFLLRRLEAIRAGLASKTSHE